MKKGITCIYKITSPTGRVYIGQTVCYKERQRHYRNSTCKGQHIIYNSIKKYGFNAHNMEILTTCEAEDLNKLERYFQEAYNVLNKKGMNIRLVGCEGRSGRVSDEVKRKISIRNSGKNNGMYGKTCSPEGRSKQKQSISGANNRLSKWILNTKTGIYYECLTEAAFTINRPKGTVWAAIAKHKTNSTDFIYA